MSVWEIINQVELLYGSKIKLLFVDSWGNGGGSSLVRSQKAYRTLWNYCSTLNPLCDLIPTSSQRSESMCWFALQTYLLVQ